jgi:hypothetical protein
MEQSQARPTLVQRRRQASMQGSELSGGAGEKAVAGRTTAGACLQRSDRALGCDIAARYSYISLPDTLREYIWIGFCGRATECAEERDLPWAAF